MTIDYKLTKVEDRVFHCVIKDQYDLAMTFCRLQEFYESPFKEIKGKNFKLLDFMKLYVEKRNENFFTYPVDWAGFNVPSNVIIKYLETPFADLNHYDDIILEIHNGIEDRDEPYYLIGSDGENLTTLKHEMCHAFYFLNKKYKKKVNSVLKDIPKSTIDKVKMVLTAMGYDKKFIMDEINAYLATEYDILLDLCDKKDEKALKKSSKELEDLLNSQFKNWAEIKI